MTVDSISSLNPMAFFSDAPRQISMFAAEDAALDQQAKIMQHAVNVLQHFEQMEKSALAVCLSLYLCAEGFKASGSKGWEKFCADNFYQLGLNQRKIREAVVIGQRCSQIADLRGGEMPNLMKMSWHTLSLVGQQDAETGAKLVLEMEKVLEETGKGPTRRELEERLKMIEADHDSLKNSVREKDAALSRNLQALNAREDELASLREEVDQNARTIQQLRDKARTPVEAVVPTLPKGVATEAEAIEQLHNQRTRILDDVAEKEAEVQRLKHEIEQLQQQAAIKKQAVSALDELERDFQSIAVKFSAALVEKITKADRNNIARMEQIANRMRAMAEQLSPSLI